MQFCAHKKSVLGISVHDKHPILLRTIEVDGTLLPVLPHRTSTLRRQEMEQIYYVNGMLYINDAREVLQNPMLSLNDNSCGYIIDPMYSIDIDTLEDVEKCVEKMRVLKNST